MGWTRLEQPHRHYLQKGRDQASWLGLVPRQHSSGGKTKLLGISKRGNFYIRKLMVEGARAAFARLNRSQHGFGPWMDNLQSGKHSNVAVVALANKMARIAWAVLTTGQEYRAATLTGEMMQIAARFTHSTPQRLRHQSKFPPVLRAREFMREKVNPAPFLNLAHSKAFDADRLVR